MEYFTQIDNQKIEINVGFNLQVVAVECVCVSGNINTLSIAKAIKIPLLQTFNENYSIYSCLFSLFILCVMQEKERKKILSRIE